MTASRFAVRDGTVERLREIGKARGQIVGRYEHSVSALVGEHILPNFSARPETAHPLSIATDEEILWELRGMPLRGAPEETPVEIDWPRISIGSIRGEVRERLAEPSLPATVSHEAIRKNLPRLERALRLFGRSAFRRASGTKPDPSPSRSVLRARLS